MSILFRVKSVRIFVFFEEGLGLGFSDFVPIDAASTYSTNEVKLLNLLSYPPSKHNNLSN